MGDTRMETNAFLICCFTRTVSDESSQSTPAFASIPSIIAIKSGQYSWPRSLSETAPGSVEESDDLSSACGGGAVGGLPRFHSASAGPDGGAAAANATETKAAEAVEAILL